MPASEEVHLQRDRAESFGAVADAYDRYRPSYPDGLIDELVGLAGGTQVLDIGTGTGKAATLLAARGVDVLGVEIDGQMAAVARGHGLTVELGSFEQWNPAGRTFALITAAQAWHWVDPAVGTPKVCGLLRPGGVFAPFWNFEELGEGELAAARPAYREHAPHLVADGITGRNRPENSPHVDALRAHGSFESVDSHVFRWTRTFPVADWVGRIGTHSDHLALGAERLATLQADLSDALLALGPEVHTTGGTYVVTGRMAG